jgi:hypothetical protein
LQQAHIALGGRCLWPSAINHILIMSYIATDIVTVPTAGFKWYMVFLEDAFEDDLRKEIEKHFLTLGREAGKDVLVVRGFDPTAFRDSVFEAPAFFSDKWRARAKFPSLILMNQPPATVLANNDAIEKAKLIIFPLKEIHAEKQSLSAFFSELVTALKSGDAMEALDKLDGTKPEKYVTQSEAREEKNQSPVAFLLRHSHAHAFGRNLSERFSC